MASIVEITDLSAPEIQIFSHLTEAQLRSRAEPEKGMFIAESAKVIAYALDAGYEPTALLMERRHIAGQGAAIIARCGDIPVYTADRELLGALTGYELTRGFICAMRRKTLPDVEALCAQLHRVAVLENIVDPTNVGAIFRSAAALGMEAVLLSPGCCDALHRRAVRVSMGTVFQLPWTRIGESISDWQESGIDRLKKMGFKTAAMALNNTAVSVEDPVLMNEEKLAVILGTEGSGLSDKTVALSDFTVKIPMCHGVDSLNVAAAAAVTFWQLRAR